jgi:hypothetical protein
VKVQNAWEKSVIAGNNCLLGVSSMCTCGPIYSVSYTWLLQCLYCPYLPTLVYHCAVTRSLCDLQIFSYPINENVACVPCAATLKTEISGTLMTLGAIRRHPLHWELSVRSGFALTPTMPKPRRVADFSYKECEGVSQVSLPNEGSLLRVKL